MDGNDHIEDTYVSVNAETRMWFANNWDKIKDLIAISRWAQLRKLVEKIKALKTRDSKDNYVRKKWVDQVTCFYLTQRGTLYL